MTGQRFVLLAMCLLALPVSAGCMGAGGESVEIGELMTENRTVPREGVKELNVSVELGIGEITIRGGATSALDAEFRYNVAEWKPVIETSERAGVTNISISQPDTESRNISGGVEYIWDLRLPEGIPCRLDLDFGVGESRIDLAGVDLVDLTIDAGVGEVDLSLRDIASEGGRVDIEGGVGEITVHVPEDTGVWVKGATGIGEFQAVGLKRSGGYLVNDAFEENGPHLDITIDAGIGSVVVDTKEQGTARA